VKFQAESWKLGSLVWWCDLFCCLLFLLLCIIL